VELLAHEQASLALAQRCSGIVGTAPLFTALLNYRHSAPSPQGGWNSAPGMQMLAAQERTNYPVAMAVDDLGEGFVLKAQTDRAIDPQRMTGYLRTAVESLVTALESNAASLASSLPIVPIAERTQLLDGFNAHQGAYPREELLHRLFEAQVERTPTAQAVRYETHALSYAELNHRANQLAHHLLAHDVGPDDLVGLCVERGVELVVGVLGIWKAGAAYVPLDPSYPAERLQYMIEDAKPKLVLTQEPLRSKLEVASIQTITLDTQWPAIARPPTTNPEALSQRSSQLAYVIYTSGSTGRPKGVMIEHRNVLNLWQGLQAPYEGCSRIALNASFNFDASVQQFLQLLSGRTLYVIPQSTRQDAHLLCAFLEEHGIEGLDCTPSQLKSWLQAGLLKRDRHRLRTVLVGGEAIEEELWRELASSHIHFYNVYGPTECTVDATIAALHGDHGSPHIGVPMLNRRVYILDEARRLLPLGMAGEIYIGGAGIGRGYLHRAELSAERFVSDPFSTDPQARLYKTGDVGRWRADGKIEYHGRNDHQVKVRGYRIELGEIEAGLRSHPLVKEAVVLAREDVPGDKRLVGYVIAQGETPSVDELRAHLLTTLPEYMVPSALVMMDQFPLSSSGKLDRRALPAPELGAYSSREYEPPQGEIEEILSGLWQELLHLPRVGRHDNFFELGGHSLLIMQLLERLRRVGLSTEVRRVFDNARLSSLARVLTKQVTGELEVPPNLIPVDCQQINASMLPLVSLEPQHIDRIVASVPGGARNVEDIYPLAPLQEGILFHHLLAERGGDAYVVPIALRLERRERLDALIGALQVVIDRHDVLRTAVLWEQLPRPVQVVWRRAQLPVEEVTLACDGDVQRWLQPQG